MNVLLSPPKDDVPKHDDVIKRKHFLRCWPFVRGIHRWSVNSPHKGQWRGALIFSLICVWINVWVNNREAGHLRRHRAHYDVIVMIHATTIFLEFSGDFVLVVQRASLWIVRVFINQNLLSDPYKYAMTHPNRSGIDPMLQASGRFRPSSGASRHVCSDAAMKFPIEGVLV